MIVEHFKLEYTKLINEISNSLGHVSFTTDIWSHQTLESYMAVTAHFMMKTSSGEICMVSRLIAFCHIEGSHTGENIGQVFVDVLRQIGALHKISMITLDNASNNGTGLEKIALCLRDLGIQFDIEGNRIRCFPHVVNKRVLPLGRTNGIFRVLVQSSSTEI